MSELGEVKRYRAGQLTWDCLVSMEDLFVRDADYARLERERGYLFSCLRDIAAVNSEYIGAAELQAMAREACSDGATEREHAAAQAELPRLRAVEKAAIAYVDADNANRERFREFCALAEACGRKG